MNDRSVKALDNAASVVRSVVLLTATIMTRAYAHTGAPSPGLDAFLAFGAIYVIFTGLVGRFAPRHRPDTAALVSLDVFYITGLVWHTGGLRSEYYLLYYLPILNASMRLDFRQAIMSSVLASACYALVAVAGGLGAKVVSSAAGQLATFGAPALVLALFFGTIQALSASQRELTEKLQQALERLSALYRVSRAIHARDSLQSVANTTLELALQLSRGYAGYVALSSETGELLVKSSRTANLAAPPPSRAIPARGRGKSPPQAGELGGHPQFDRHLAEHCLVRRSPVITDARGDHPELARSGAGYGALSVPLACGDHAYGALQVFGSPGATFDERDTELLAALAQEASVAIENARLLTEVRRLSVSDELTGLYHRGEFRRLLAAQVETARLQGDPIAVILFDVDGIRGINLQHGHQAGDAVLLAFADLLRRGVRAQDIAARYGADEFAVLLPGGGLDAARAVATRLCQAMAHHEFQFEGDSGAHQSHPAARKVTVCAGAVAAGGTAPPLPSNADHLVGRADEALFEAKQAGPGQIRFWEATTARHGGAGRRKTGQVQGTLTAGVRQIVEQVRHFDDSDWR